MQIIRFSRHCQLTSSGDSRVAGWLCTRRDGRAKSVHARVSLSTFRTTLVSQLLRIRKLTFMSCSNIITTHRRLLPLLINLKFHSIASVMKQLPVELPAGNGRNYTQTGYAQFTSSRFEGRGKKKLYICVTFSLFLLCCFVRIFVYERGWGSSRRNNWQFNKCGRVGQTKINQLEGLCNVENKLSVHPRRRNSRSNINDEITAKSRNFNIRTEGGEKKCFLKCINNKRTTTEDDIRHDEPTERLRPQSVLNYG